MTARRNPFATLFAALFVWLTSVGSMSSTHVQERRLMPAGGETVATITSAVPRPTLVVARELTRPPALPDQQVADVPRAYAPLAVLPAFDVLAVESHARRAQRIASTYDAMAPPVMAAFIG
jgi:hypothetical protein